MGKVKTIILIFLFLWLIALVTSWLIGAPRFSNTIAVIPLEGVIHGGTDATSILSAGGTSSLDFIARLDEAVEDPLVKGIVIQINSPGGTVVASKEIADAIKGIDKPVVAWIREAGTSGAYWVASASDAIVADPLSLTGSIGVTSSYLSFGDLLEDYNVTYQRLVTGKYKDLATPFKELTNEERALLEKKLYDIHDYFVAEVARNRDLPEENVRALATGEFFLGQEALPLGLVDYLGGKETAMNITKQLANITSAEEKVYKEKLGFLDVFSSFAESRQPRQMELQIR